MRRAARRARVFIIPGMTMRMSRRKMINHGQTWGLRSLEKLTQLDNCLTSSSKIFVGFECRMISDFGCPIISIRTCWIDKKCDCNQIIISEQYVFVNVGPYWAQWHLMIDSVLSSFVFVIKEIFKSSRGVADKTIIQMFKSYFPFLTVTLGCWRYGEDGGDFVIWPGIRFLVQNLFGPERYVPVGVFRWKYNTERWELWWGEVT